MFAFRLAYSSLIRPKASSWSITSCIGIIGQRRHMPVTYIRLENDSSWNNWQWLSGVKKNMLKNYSIAKQYWQYGEVSFALRKRVCLTTSRALIDQESKETDNLRDETLGACGADGERPKGILDASSLLWLASLTNFWGEGVRSACDQRYRSKPDEHAFPHLEVDSRMVSRIR